MGYKSKRKRTKSRNKYSRRRRNRVTKRVSNRGRNRVTRKYKGGMDPPIKKIKQMTPGEAEEARLEQERLEAEAEAAARLEQERLEAAAAAAVPRIPKGITGLALPRGNLIYEHNLSNFKPEHHLGLPEYDINMVGPDFDSIPHEAKQFVLNWRNNPENRRVNPPWSEYIGKLCEVPPGFFVNNPPSGRNLSEVKNNLTNFNQNFPKVPTNANIVEIPTYILGVAQNGVAMRYPDQPIPQGKYKFVLMKNDEIRYIPDTGNRKPYYYFPSIMLYFYNIEKITLEELKQYLGNELPHSLLFNAKLEKIMSGGDFTINEYGYLVKASGYSGHIKPDPPNVYLAMQTFINMGYPLVLERGPSYDRLQTGNTDRTNDFARMFGAYLHIEFVRPQVPALDNAAAVSDEASI